MKFILPIMPLLFSALLMSGNSYSQDETQVLEGPYLGQTPPGLTPEAFAPGIVSTEYWEYGPAFTPDLKELYLIREDKDEEQTFVVFQNINNQWHETVVSPRVGQPFISPDGKTMHLGRRYKERTASGWSEIKSLGSPYDEIRIMSLTVSSKGTYVFDDIGPPDGYSILHYSRIVDGKREEPRPLSKEINTGKYNAHPFIAPDESYIMWDGQRGSVVRNADIYISFKQQDGSWGEAIKMGDKINTAASENSARVTPDGKYLFFNRNMGSRSVDIYWVDAQIIEDLRPKE